MKFLQAFLLVFVTAFLSQQVAAKGERVDLKSKVKAVQEELDGLISQGGGYAYLQLSRKTGISPFAVAIQADKSVIMMEVPKSEKDATIADKVLKLREMLRVGADNEKFVAAALFVQAKVPHLGEEVDGLAIEMEHKEGLSILRFSPYEVNKEKKDINFQKPIDKVKPATFFVKNKVDQKVEQAKASPNNG